MNCFELETDERELHYGRYSSDILYMLQDAVETRAKEGVSRKQLADLLGWDPSQLSRILNGRVPNLTVRSISDILWAARYLPDEPHATPFEKLSPNHLVHFALPGSANSVVQFEVQGEKPNSVAASSGRAQTVWIGGFDG